GGLLVRFERREPPGVHPGPPRRLFEGEAQTFPGLPYHVAEFVLKPRHASSSLSGPTPTGELPFERFAGLPGFAAARPRWQEVPAPPAGLPVITQDRGGHDKGRRGWR